MRFLTVPELLPRRELVEWVSSWAARTDNALRERSLDTHFVLFNEGTLLLYRAGHADVAKAFCARALQSTKAGPSGSFHFQQVINMVRLAVAGRDWMRASSLLQLAEDEYASGDEQHERMKPTCQIERCASFLAGGRFDKLSHLESVAVDAVKPCVVETELRVVLSEGLSCNEGRTRAQLVETLLKGSGLVRLAGLCFEVSVTSPDHLKLVELKDSILSMLMAQPVHMVQVGEFVLKSALKEETQIELHPIVEPLLEASKSIGDVPGVAFFSGRLGYNRPPAGTVMPKSISSQIQSRLDALLARIDQVLD
jgi:hypothetical protein